MSEEWLWGVSFGLFVGAIIRDIGDYVRNQRKKGGAK